MAPWCFYICHSLVLQQSADSSAGFSWHRDSGGHHLLTVTDTGHRAASGRLKQCTKVSHTNSPESSTIAALDRCMMILILLSCTFFHDFKCVLLLRFLTWTDSKVKCFLKEKELSGFSAEERWYSCLWVVNCAQTHCNERQKESEWAGE